VTHTAPSKPRTSESLPWIVLALGIPLCVLLYSIVHGATEDAARFRFERQARDALAVIEERIQFYADILYGLRALFASQGPVNRLQFHRFVASLNLKERFPGFDVVNYAVYVPTEAKETFIESVRTDTSLDPRGYPDFDIRPAGDRSEYFVIAYMEPMEGFEFAFGRDLGANPDAASPQPLVVALHTARDSGTLTASGVPIRIKSRGKEYTGLAMRLAVYRSGELLDTVAQRRAAYIGSVGAGFNIEDLMRGVIDEHAIQNVRLQVLDVRSALQQSGANDDREPRLLFDSKSNADNRAKSLGRSNSSAMFSHTLTTEVGGRIWEVQFSAPKTSTIGQIDRALPSIVLLSGLLITFLLFGVLYSLASSRSRAITIAEDITKDLRESEKVLRASTEQLQALSRRLVDAQEAERRQLSRELHDRVGQNLTALGISLDILRTQVPQEGAPELRSRLEDTAGLVETTAGMIENVMSELRPPMLDDYGLQPALEWYANEYARRTGVAAQVHASAALGRLDQATEIGLFRIAQEALNNVAKHAHAHSVRIELARTEQRYEMSITDDGKGLQPIAASAPRRRPGLGMVTMRERTQALGGEFEISAGIAGGTTIRVTVPC